jgi:hypothetical protein
MNIAFLGYGQVGSALADHLQKLGHEVSLAASDPSSEKLRQALARNPKLKVLPPKEAVGPADVVFLATPFQANEPALKAVATELEGKVLVDCTNPVGPDLSHGLKSLRSGSELVQELAPGAEVVKAFTIYGYENFEDNSFPLYGVKPAMMYCGRNAVAKERVAGLIRQLGWEALDVGGLEQALHLEHMTLLWARMVRSGGRSPHTVWAMLTK